MTHRTRWTSRWSESVRAYLRDRPNKRAFASNSLWLILDKAVRAILALTVGAYVARALGPAAFGEYTYAITLVAMFLALTNLGADGIAVRDLARAPEKAAATLGTIIWLRLAAGLVCWPLAMAVVYVLRPEDQKALLLVALVGIGLVVQSAETMDLWLQSQSQNRRSVSAKLIAYVLGNAVRIGLIVWEAPLWAFALSVAVDSVLANSALRIAYRSFPVASRWSFDWSLGKALLRQSWPFMLSGLAVLIYMRIDQIMVREMLGETALGVYSSAVFVSQMWYFLPVTLCTALAPYIARKREESHDAYLAALAIVFRVFALSSVAVALFTILLSKPLITTLYGVGYEAAVPVLSTHILSNIFVFLGTAQGLWLVNEGLGRLTLYRTVLGAAVSVLGNLVLIPSFGLQGAALSTVVAMFISAVASNAIWAPTIFKMQLRAFLPIPLRT